ncbi:hypothetical protein [Sphingomonas aerolata]|uniref:hypothetical protein n=1 Tax=Sphingomonas aerolata TaxID=185951 RepID=UPI002FE36452
MIPLDDIKAMLATKTKFEITKVVTVSYYHQCKVYQRNPDLLDKFREAFSKYMTYYDIDDAAYLFQIIQHHGMKDGDLPNFYGDEEQQHYRTMLERMMRSRDSLDLKASQRALGISEEVRVGGRSWSFGGEAA